MQTQAKWLHIEQGVFELTEWHAIAKEWFGEKPRNSEEVRMIAVLKVMLINSNYMRIYPLYGKWI